MINLTPTQPASWTPASQPVALPVPAVIAVTPASAASRDSATQQQFGGRGDTRTPAAETGAGKTNRGAETRANAEPAPLLPREKREQDRGAATVRDNEAERKAEQEAIEEQAERTPSFQDMLSTVWQASAAVVEVVLGREPALPASSERAAAAAQATGAASAAAGSSGVSGPRANTSAAANEAQQPDLLPGLRAQQEPVAYTEQGTSSWLPLEAGTLISRRV